MTHSDPNRISDDQHNNAPAVPQGWAFSVSDDDDGTWLRVKSPGGREAAFSAVNGGLAHDNRRSIASRVLLELKEALAATPSPAPAQEQDDGDVTGTYGLLPEHGWDEVPKDKGLIQINVRIGVPSDWERRGDMQTIIEREVKAERWAWLYVDTKPAQKVVLTDAWLLEQFKHHPNWELSTSNDPECDPSVFWLVHEVKGGRNDREWFLIGEGDTPRNAIIAALRANGG